MDSMDDGIVAFDHQGRMAIRNRCARRLIEADPDRQELLVAIGDLHRSLTPWLDRVPSNERRTPDDPRLHSTQITVRTASTEYRLRGSAIAHPDAHATSRGVVITVSTRSSATHLSPAELRQRYRLTPTEIRVAWLIDGGLPTRDIAAALSITLNTARRHAESVLRKLGVHSRPAVRSRLRRE
jgi:DNA-binding CsgD family transcriptional regulator